MISLPFDRTIADLVREDPARAEVFERHGIGYCCSANRPWVEACREAGQNPKMILRELSSLHAPQAQDWDARLDRLVMSSDRALALTERVAERHGERDARLVRLRDAFRRFHACLPAIDESALDRVRAEALQFVPPSNACNTHLAMLNTLQSIDSVARSLILR